MAGPVFSREVENELRMFDAKWGPLDGPRSHAFMEDLLSLLLHAVRDFSKAQAERIAERLVEAALEEGK